jgi:N-acyl homoserine lactone hydrolase
MYHCIRPLMLGRMKMNKSLMTYLMNCHKEIWVPVVCWYVRAGDKDILIDSGAPPEIMQKFWYGEYEEITTFEQALNSVGVSPDDIDIIIQTHLHFDHCGNTPKCRNAEVIVQRAELEFARDPHPVFFGSYPQSLIPESNFTQIEGDAEVVPGIRVIHVAGHSPGTQAVSIETETGKVILSGFCSIRDNFSPPEKMRKIWPVLTPGVHVDSLEAFNSAKRIKGLGHVIVPIHDIEYASKAYIP